MSERFPNALSVEGGWSSPRLTSDGGFIARRYVRVRFRKGGRMGQEAFRAAAAGVLPPARPGMVCRSLRFSEALYEDVQELSAEDVEDVGGP